MTVRVWASRNSEGRPGDASALERSHADLCAALNLAVQRIRESNPDDRVLPELRDVLRDARSIGQAKAAVPLSTRMDPMKIALRILTAVSDKREPGAADTDTLTRLYGPKAEGAGWDEYTCDVIQAILRDRSAGRRAFQLR